MIVDSDISAAQFHKRLNLSPDYENDDDNYDDKNNYDDADGDDDEAPNKLICALLSYFLISQFTRFFDPHRGFSPSASVDSTPLRHPPSPPTGNTP